MQARRPPQRPLVFWTAFALAAAVSVLAVIARLGLI